MTPQGLKGNTYGDTFIYTNPYNQHMIATIATIIVTVYNDIAHCKKKDVVVSGMNFRLSI